MKILLLRPVNTTEGYKKFESEDSLKYRRTGESLALGYLAAVLEKEGHSVSLIDGNLQNLGNREIIDRINTASYDIIGFSANVYSDLNNDLNIIKALNISSKTFIFVGGHVATFMDEYILCRNPRINCVVRYEGEIPLILLSKAVSNGDDWHTVPNLSYIQDNIICRTECYKLEDNYLDTLPFPRRDMMKYLNRQSSLINICTSRGCYGNCSFCSVRSFYSGRGAKWRGRSPENVVSEIQTIYDKYGYDNYLFVDDNYVGPGKQGAERIEKIAHLLIDKQLRIHYATNFRANDVVRCKDILPLLKQSGLSYVFLGTESGCSSQLAFFNKQISVDINKEAVNLLDINGIGVTQGLIIFDYRMSVKELWDNLLYVKATEGVNAGKLYSKLLIYHGTALHESIKNREGIVEECAPIEMEFEDPNVAKIYSIVSKSLSWGAELYNLIEDLFWDCAFRYHIEFPNDLKDLNNRINHRLIEYMQNVVVHVTSSAQTEAIDAEIIRFILSEAKNAKKFSQGFSERYSLEVKV